MDPVNLAAKLATFGDHWQPRTVFLVLAGHLTIELRDRSVRLGPGEHTGDAATAAPRRVV
jgi:hypothetical protein